LTSESSNENFKTDPKPLLPTDLLAFTVSFSAAGNMGLLIQ